MARKNRSKTINTVRSPAKVARPKTRAVQPRQERRVSASSLSFANPFKSALTNPYVRVSNPHSPYAQISPTGAWASQPQRKWNARPKVAAKLLALPSQPTVSETHRNKSALTLAPSDPAKQSSPKAREDHIRCKTKPDSKKAARGMGVSLKKFVPWC